MADCSQIPTVLNDALVEYSSKHLSALQACQELVSLPFLRESELKALFRVVEGIMQSSAAGSVAVQCIDSGSALQQVRDAFKPTAIQREAQQLYAAIRSRQRELARRQPVENTAPADQ